MPRNRGKMLVIRGGAIGDFILTIPAMTALRETFEETHIEVLGYPHLAELARTAGIIEAYKSIESGPLAGFFGRNTRLNPEWVSYFESFNLIVSYLYDPDGIFQTNVGRSSKAQFIVGPHRPSETENIHATEAFLQPLEKLAIFGADPVPKIYLPRPTTVRKAGAFRLAIHPGSGSAKKNWPPQAWIQFCKLLLEQTNWQVTIVGGEAEGETISILQQALPLDRVSVAQSQSLLDTARLLARCDFFMGHDSGITHLAGALGVPLLALWGPSNFNVWRPLGPQTHFIRPPEPLAELPVQTVLERVLELHKAL